MFRKYDSLAAKWFCNARKRIPYRYTHDEPHAYAAGETYMPEGMVEPAFYQPVNRGLETKIAEKLAFLRQLDEEADS